MTKHTPGPWTAKFINCNNKEYNHVVSLVEYDEEGELKLVCEMGWTEEDLANARLIAEAPAMFDALVDLIDQLEGIGIPDWHGAEGLYLGDARDTIERVKIGE